MACKAGRSEGSRGRMRRRAVVRRVREEEGGSGTVGREVVIWGKAVCGRGAEGGNDMVSLR